MNYYKKNVTIDHQLEVEILHHTVYFALADIRSDSHPCSRKKTYSISLDVRHAVKLNLRYMDWFISDRPVIRAIFGKNMLQIWAWTVIAYYEPL